MLRYLYWKTTQKYWVRKYLNMYRIDNQFYNASSSLVTILLVRKWKSEQGGSVEANYGQHKTFPCGITKKLEPLSLEVYSFLSLDTVASYLQYIHEGRRWGPAYCVRPWLMAIKKIRPCLNKEMWHLPGSMLMC